MATPVPQLELTRPDEVISVPIRVRSFPLRASKTFPNTPHFDLDSLPKYEKFKKLGNWLRQCMSEQAGTSKDNNNIGTFLPPAILDRLFSKEVIERELEKEDCGLDTANIVKIMFRADEEELEEEAKTYFTIFAILALLERVCDVSKFVEGGDKSICDQDLPLELQPGEDPGSKELRRKDESQQSRCFHRWRDHELEYFDNYQWRLRVPTFGLNPDKTLRHYKLHDRDILPWCEEHSVSQQEVMSGGYGSVKKVKIHPLCHEYHETLKAINVSGGLFAVKTLKDSDDVTFQKEVNSLKKFNGMVHDHLVTLLGTFTHKKQFNMIFPSAECDVENYWKKINPSPNLEDIEFVRWVSRQCRGIMEAIDIIHNPKRPTTLSQESQEAILYGRHGDIKPENILWFKSSNEADRGIWVISDLGLTAFNREISRSMVPNKSILYTPGYRPPECDIKGGKISRAFDIWTLGCFYLEMLCWLLGGWQLKEDFETERCKAVFITGSGSDIFFDLQLSSGDDKTNEEFIAIIKPQVSEMINDLHNHQDSTDYVHDFLDIIEDDMLVVLSVDRQRQRSPELLERLDKMNQKCIDDVNYCTRKTPPPIRRIVRVSTGTEARLNDNAMKMVEKNNVRSRLSTHVPRPEKPVHKSMREEELRNLK
ncbi:uncharacterized protein PAC_13759 [Phialocephala subalpina]|uniref:Protein kinase domain-containing protein n=1 Tax=Phialocephala subalpina TaxID=576137 RepID=A0A1L7XFQ4_9HELO|nr:uncharacterized protein PAC_13759 [Phialocephala subalpina]